MWLQSERITRFLVVPSIFPAGHPGEQRLMRVIRAALKIVRALSVWILDSVCLLIPYSSRACAVVTRLDAIGDFFLWMQGGAADISVYLRSLGLRPILIANSGWAEFAQTTGLWDRVISVDSVRLIRSPFYRVRQLTSIRRMGASYLIQPRAARLFLLEDAIARTSGATRRIGSSGTLLNTSEFLRRIGNTYYSDLIDVRSDEVVHELLRNQAFVRGLTGRECTAYEFQPVIRNEVDAPIVVAMGAGESGRIWPIEKLAVLLQHIISAHPVTRIVIVGRACDAAAAEQLMKLIGGGASNLVGQTTLSGYIEIIAAATIVISNESSAYHIALAFKRPVLCLVGGGHYGLFAPYPWLAQTNGLSIVVKNELECFGCNWKCKFQREPGGAFRCVATIDVRRAIDGFELLSARVKKDD